MIAAGVGAKALSTYMGHSSIVITLDRYGHLFPGSRNADAELLDAYLARADRRHDSPSSTRPNHRREVTPAQGAKIGERQVSMVVVAAEGR